MASVLAVTLLAIAAAQASLALSARQAITALTTADIDHFTPYTYYASAGYCTPAQTSAWDCGANCQANPSFKPVASGGNGDSVQYWYVGYDPNLNSVIVVHQGTNPSQMQSLVTDADIYLRNLNSGLFPGISSDIQVHNGFADDQEITATDILAAVRNSMSQYSTTSVTLVGHSLGAALSLLDSVYLRLWLPSGTTIQMIGYGLPRVGNKAFADYLSTNSLPVHINNKEDPIPTLPGEFLGFAHPAGEIHIEDSGEWMACPGEDNPSKQCIVGDVPYIWDGNLANHDGPYNGITMGC